MSSSSVNGSTTGSQIPTSHQQQQCQEGGIDHTKEEKSPASHTIPSSSLPLVEYHAFASLVDEVGAPIRLGGESSNPSPSQFAVARQTHVRYDSNLTSQPPPSLTGRTHQRFEGEARLVCGCVPFRIDRIPRKRRREAEKEEENKRDAADDASVMSPTSPPSVDDESEYDLRLSVLLVHAKKKGDWIFAKGGWEEFETAGECAQREALEEGGVEGELISQLTPIAFTSKKGKLSQMTPFLLRVTLYHQHFAEAGKRHRRWIPYHQVDQFMKREETKEIWKNAKEKLRACGWMDEKERPIWKEEEINPSQH